jgi:hypothetical protein
MDEEFVKFINDSYIGKTVELPVNIIIHRNDLSPDDLAFIRENGVYECPYDKDPLYEMEAGGEIFANGKIVRKNGEYFFKVMNVDGGRL